MMESLVCTTYTRASKFSIKIANCDTYMYVHTLLSSFLLRTCINLGVVIFLRYAWVRTCRRGILILAPPPECQTGRCWMTAIRRRCDHKPGRTETRMCRMLYLTSSKPLEHNSEISRTVAVESSMVDLQWLVKTSHTHTLVPLTQRFS